MLSVENTEKPEDKREICPYSTLWFAFHSVNFTNPAEASPTSILYHTPTSALSFFVIPTWDTLLTTKQCLYCPWETSARFKFSHKLFLNYSSGILGLLPQSVSDVTFFTQHTSEAHHCCLTCHNLRTRALSSVFFDNFHSSNSSPLPLTYKWEWHSVMSWLFI